MMKVVMKVETLNDEKTRRKVMRAVGDLIGISTITADTKGNKLTVIGNADVVIIVKKVRKVWPSTTILTVDQAKEEKPKQPKKEEPNPKEKNTFWANPYAYSPLYSYPTTHYYYYHSQD